MAIFKLQHHQALAAAIGKADRYDDGELVGPGLVEAIIAMLTADNPTFDRAEFEADIGVAGGGAGFIE